MPQWRIQCVVLFANACLVAACAACGNFEVVWEPAFWAVLLIASMVCAADVVRISLTTSLDRLPESKLARLLCHLTGLAVLAVWCTAIVFAKNSFPFALPAGIVVAAVGAAIRRQAVASLGGDFVSDVRSERQGENALLTQGLYAYVRHPSELGLALATLGAGIATGSTVSLAVWLCCLMPLGYVRIRLEESHLRNRFGKAYQEYERRVGLYLPRII